jgi:hypothetical protein
MVCQSIPEQSVIIFSSIFFAFCFSRTKKSAGALAIGCIAGYAI